MKSRITITIDENNLKLIENLLKESSKFRNKSHLVECSLIKFLGEEGR